MNLSRIGLDLAKQVFQVHGVDRHEHVVCRRQLKRAQVRDFFRQLPPCLVAMEACGSAHYWARELRELGHTVRLIAPQFVKPYVKGDKHDAHDAEAICEAASRPSMRYVPVKSAEQQAVQSMHRVRSRLVRARTALCNEVRGLLGEFGLIARLGVGAMALLETVMATEPASLPAPMGELLRELKDELQTLEARIARLERQIQAHVRGDARIQRLLAVEGIGPISASAVAASAGDARQFRTGRQFAAWLGLVPRQLHGRAAAGQHQQARRYLLADLAHPWHPCSRALLRQQDRCPQPLAAVCNGVLPMSSPLPWPTRMPGSFGPYSAGRHATGPVERSCHTVVETSTTIAQ